MSDARMVKMAELWERTSAKGTRYFSGFMGDCQLLLFDGGEKDHPTRPGEKVHIWRLMLQERDPSRRPQTSPTRTAERGQGIWDRSRDRERHAARSRAQQAGEAVLREAGRDPRPEPPADFYDDSREAVADLEGRGR